MSTLLTPARKLKEFPILHRFVSYFITEYMSEVTPIYSNVFSEVAEYEVSEYCSCMECGTFYLKTPSEENIFSYFHKVSDDMFFMRDLGGHVFIPKMYVDPETDIYNPADIDFEIVGYPDDIYNYPYVKELLEDKRDTDDEEAWRLVHEFFKDKKEKPIQSILIDNED
ncbi:MAG: hypothetical protein IBX44_00005 [Sulfurospirillum sp.]|nr:hypothetical protein [Sulfurospirillum sp.]